MWTREEDWKTPEEPLDEDKRGTKSDDKFAAAVYKSYESEGNPLSPGSDLPPCRQKRRLLWRGGDPGRPIGP